MKDFINRTFKNVNDVYSNITRVKCLVITTMKYRVHLFIHQYFIRKTPFWVLKEYIDVSVSVSMYLYTYIHLSATDLEILK